jgi:hypothetical protein
MAGTSDESLRRGLKWSCPAAVHAMNCSGCPRAHPFLVTGLLTCLPLPDNHPESG